MQSMMLESVSNLSILPQNVILIGERGKAEFLFGSKADSVLPPE